jgi:hypothetical protein
VEEYSLSSKEEKEFKPYATLTYIDYDVVLSKYLLDLNKTDLFITSDEISEDRKNIKGTLNMAFVVDKTYNYVNSTAIEKIDFPGGSWCQRGVEMKSEFFVLKLCEQVLLIFLSPLNEQLPTYLFEYFQEIEVNLWRC